MFGGKMPKTDNLPDRWYDTPNIHLCTIKDFLDLCKDVGAKVERADALNAYGARWASPCRSSCRTYSASRLSFYSRANAVLSELTWTVLGVPTARSRSRADEALIRNLLSCGLRSFTASSNDFGSAY
jgi:hypothetical protein